MARKFVFDKKTGALQDVTPERERVTAEALEKDARQIRKRLKPSKIYKAPKYPITPEAMGVDESDIPAAMEIARKHGVPTEYTRTGEPIINSQNHLQRYCRAFGYYQRNSNDSPANR